MIASFKGHLDVVKVLLKYGADPNIVAVGVRLETMSPHDNSCGKPGVAAVVTMMGSLTYSPEHTLLPSSRHFVALFPMFSC